MQIKLPNLGEGADSGTVASVLIKVGDTIEKDQTILEVENEKAVVPVPASAGGKVTKIAVKEGDTVNVGQLLLVLDEEQGDAKPDKPSKSDKEETESQEADEAEREEGSSEEGETTQEVDPNAPVPVASPTVRRICDQLGLDLRQIPTRSRGGRVELQDLRTFIQRSIKASSSKAKSEKKEPASSIDFSQWGPVTKEPMSELRKAISRRMTESTTTIPRVTQFDSIDITDLDALRRKYSSRWKEENAPLTPTVFAIAAVVATLKKHPLFRSSLDEATREIVLKDYYHIGIAVDTEGGLMVPVIRDADRKSMLQLAKELAEKAALARDRKLKSEDMKGGVFTISNQGGIGGGHFTPIINKPESAILGIGRSLLQPAVVDGKIGPRLLMPITISYDHRLIDGAEAARFTVSLDKAFHQISEKDLTTR